MTRAEQEVKRFLGTLAEENRKTTGRQLQEHHSGGRRTAFRLAKGHQSTGVGAEADFEQVSRVNGMHQKAGDDD